jgi:membrane fusion protein (multidrug efflux system)
MSKTLYALFAAAVLALSACTSDEPPAEEHAEGTVPAGPTNRIDIPPAVVQNLGITFARVERRRVDRTLRIPGAFEVPPEAERVYRMPLDGRVTLLVTQYGRVQAGDAIAAVDSPQWRQMQQELDALDAAVAGRRAELVQTQAQRQQAADSIGFFAERIAAFDPQLAAIALHIENLAAARDLWQARVIELEDLMAKGAGKAADLAEARSQHTAAQGALSDEAETKAELERARAQVVIDEKLARTALPSLEAAEQAAAQLVSAAERSFDLSLRGATTTLGVDFSALKDNAWRALDTVTVRASTPGIVLDLDVRDGELLEAGDLLCLVLDDRRLRFRARGLQSDLGKLRDGLTGSVVPPAGGTMQDAAPAHGVITLAPMADADSRLVDVMMALDQAPPWARPGVGAELEIAWDPAADELLAVPSRALIRDGLDVLFFVRDPANPDKVIRTVAETGPTDGRWTVVYTGVMEGSEVVLDGTYELKLTGAGKSTLKGHFHADGTFHAEGTPEPGGG